VRAIIAATIDSPKARRTWRIALENALIWGMTVIALAFLILAAFQFN
jgi:hypothetical protein